MGLMDVLNGMQNGPRGQKTPGSGGMSPITMAILALLAYKAFGKLSSGGQAAAPAGMPAPTPTQAGSSGGLGDLLGGNNLGGLLQGGLGGLMKGGLGGLLAGGAAGSVLSGGLNEVLKQFQNNGQGQAARSWISTGSNEDVSESDLAKALGGEDIDALARHAGVSREELLAGLRKELPGVVDQLTPNGRIPSGDELSRMMRGA